MDTHLTTELKGTSNSRGSTTLKVVTNLHTGRSELVLSHQVTERLELNKDNKDLFTNKYKGLNPQSGWVVKIQDIIDLINK